MKSVESAVSNDFDDLLNALVIGEGKSYVIRGFTISMAGAIGSAASGLQLLVADSSFLHGNSSKSGTFFTIPTGTPAEVLSSTTNTKVEGSFTPSTDNFIGLEFVREVDDTTTDQVAFWNPTTNIETTKTVPLAIILDYKIVISTSSFASNVLPIAIVQTDVSNNVVEITDRRAMLYRLATAGGSEPDPFHDYPWTDGRAENFYKSTSSSSDPFFGGDKQIATMKDWLDALMTEIKLFKGTPYWYSEGTGGSISTLRQDIANTTITGRGSISHDETVSGLLNWSQDFFINFIGGRLRYNINGNAATSDITLSDNQVCYVNLIRGVNITPNLVFTNGGAEVTSIGAVGWTSDLVVGDFVKNAAEGDEKYYEILSIDSASQVTLTENFQEVSSGVGGFNAQYAFGSYQTDAAPSTDRHLRIADRGSVPFGQDYFWLFSRQDNGSSIPFVYIRALGGGELEKGEVQEISDNTSADVLSYIGSTSESDKDPEYASLAGSAKTGTENYNTTNGENLTIRASKLTSMLASKAQDKTIQILSNHTSVNNTTNILAQDITMSGGSGSITVVVPSSTNNGTIGTGGVLSLNINQSAYFTINRNAAFAVANLSALTVVDTDSLPLGENIFVFAYRTSNVDVYLWDGSLIEVGTTISPSSLLSNVRQNKTVKLVDGGTWSWNLATTTLANSAIGNIQVAGLAVDVNDIAIQNIVLANDGECAYISLKRTAGASTRTVTIADIASVPHGDDIFIIARRIGNDVIVGTSSFALKDGEFLELDGALAEINRYHGQLAVNPANPISNRIVVSGSDIAKLSGSQLSLQQNNLLLDFGGVEIDFGTGEIFESDGVTPFLAGANDFTPFAIGANEFFYYSISLLPNAANADNTISGQMLVIPATSSNAVLSTAPKASFPSLGISLANVLVQEDGAGGILNIEYSNVTQLSVGGSGGSGTGLVKVKYHDPVSTTLPTGATVTLDGQAGVNGDLVLFSNLIAGNNKIYKLSGVGVAIAWESTLDFNLGTPEDGDTVIVQSGDSFKEAIGVFNGTDWKFNDTVRYFSGADYWEQSSLKTTTLTASTTDDVFTVELLGSENMIVDYSIANGVNKETGQIILSSDGTNVEIARTVAFNGDVDVTLFADIVATTLRLRYTNNTVSTGTIKYSVKRWSNASGGPGGIPSYSGVSGSTIAASGAISDIQYKGASGNLDGDSSFQWDDTNKEIKLNGLRISELKGPTTLNDGQIVPASFLILDSTTNKNIVLEYSIERNGEDRTGRLLVSNNTSNTAFSDDFVETSVLGVALTATISGTDVLLQYTTTSTGFTGSIKYSIRKWS